MTQAFASEKTFGVLSETLYELLQLVSKRARKGAGMGMGWRYLGGRMAAVLGDPASGQQLLELSHFLSF